MRLLVLLQLYLLCLFPALGVDTEECSFQPDFIGGGVEDDNMERNCLLEPTDTFKVCCSTLRPLNKSQVKRREVNYYKRNCRVVSKKYVPSEFEENEFRMARSIAHLPMKEEGDAMYDILSHPEYVKNSSIWVNRVMYLMRTPVERTKPHPHDDTFLSYFLVEYSCAQGVTKTVRDYIEPITMFGRNPTAASSCRTMSRLRRLLMVNYILLGKNRPDYKNYYMFDVGTSGYKSSLWWFMCAYDRNHITFDHIYGYEYSLINPVRYWRQIPMRYKPLIHFMNTPASGSVGNESNPFEIMTSIASEEDFVALKLDVDTTDVEIPIMLQLLEKPELHSLVDEFFFELHFKCGIMTECGWDNEIPDEKYGFKFDRVHVMEFFRKLRNLGVRAHIWP